MKNKKRFFSLIFSVLIGSVWLVITGCYSRFTMSNKEVCKYYETHKPEPEYYSYDTLGHTVFYVHAGYDTLPVLLFIHGAPGRWSGYIKYISDSTLLRHFQIISVDRPGYGNSAKGGEVLSIEMQAKLLKPILDKYNKYKILIAGRSYGAPIAVRLAADYPQNVAALLLISSASAPKLEKFWWFSKPVHTWVGKLLFKKPINRASDEKFAHQKELYKLLPFWAKVTQPSIILQGGKDFIIYPENGKFTDSALVNSPHRYIFLPKNGHLITNENPEVVKGALLELSSKM